MSSVISSLASLVPVPAFPLPLLSSDLLQAARHPITSVNDSNKAITFFINTSYKYVQPYFTCCGLFGNDRHQPFTAPIMIPLVKYFWKNGYTRMMGVTTKIVTVILTEVDVDACAKVLAMEAVDEVELTIAASDPDEFM
jgi:hypothetical protein